MTTDHRRWLRIVALLAFVLLLIAFGRHVDWRAAFSAVRGADAWLLLVALACNQLSLALKGVRWWVFLRPLGVHSLALVLRATFAGASLNNLVVAQGGEGARVLFVSRATGVSSARVAGALALERVLDAVSYLALLVSASWLLEVPDAVARWRTSASVGLGLLAIVMTSLGLVARCGGFSSAESAAERGKVHAYLRRFGASVATLGTPARLSGAMALSLLAWTLQVVTYHLVARAAHLPVPFAASVGAMLAIGISFLVRATPGNVGVFQVIYALTMRGFGIEEGPAVAAALLIQLIQIIPTILIGMLASHGLVSGRRTPATSIQSGGSADDRGMTPD
jgi:uncharacterized protein (TIRG00374 family)